GFGMLNAMHLGDVINDLIYQIRPFEVNKGETDRVFREMVDGLCEDLRSRKSFEIEERAPEWAKPKFKSNKVLRNMANVFRQVARAHVGQGLSECIARRPRKDEFDRS